MNVCIMLLKHQLCSFLEVFRSIQVLCIISIGAANWLFTITAKRWCSQLSGRAEKINPLDEKVLWLYLEI